MLSDESDCQGLYENILSQLEKMGASSLATKIKDTVARGTIVSGKKNPSSKEIRLFRPMTPKELLAIALQFIVTSLQVPMMVLDTQSILGGSALSWLPDEPEVANEKVDIRMPFDLDDVDLRNRLKKLTSLIHGLNLTVPEAD